MATPEGWKAAAQGVGDVVEGIGEGALQTVHGTGELIRKGANLVHSGMGDKIIPASGQTSLQTIATPDQGEGHTGQVLGKTAEDVAEFVMGDEALKGLSIAERAMKAVGLAEKYEKASPFARRVIEHMMNAGRQGTVTGTETLGKTGDVGQAAEAGLAGGVTSGVISGVASAAPVVGKVSGKVARGVSALLTDIPAATESGLVDAIGDAAEHSGFERSDAKTLKAAVSDLADNFKSRAQDVYQQLDEDAPGFQELRDKIAQQTKAYRVQLNLDPAKASEIEAQLTESKARLNDLLSDEQKSRWQTADKDWSRYRALQQVQGKANAATDLTSDELSDVSRLHAGVKSLTNKVQRGVPTDVISKAFGDDAQQIKAAVQKGINSTDEAHTAKQFLKWAGGLGLLGTGAHVAHLIP